MAKEKYSSDLAAEGLPEMAGRHRKSYTIPKILTPYYMTLFGNSWKILMLEEDLVILSESWLPLSLSIKITSWRLVNTGVILTFGMTKAIMTYLCRVTSLTTLAHWTLRLVGKSCVGVVVDC